MLKFLQKIFPVIEGKEGLFPVIFALLMCAKILGFATIPFLIPITYLAFFIVAICAFKNGGKYDTLNLIFLLYLPLTIIISDPDEVFNPWMRYGLFVIMYAACSPMIVNRWSIDFRHHSWNVILVCCMLIGAISFLCYFLGINLMRSVWDGSKMAVEESSGGKFGGITSHSMLLGPLSGIGAIASVYSALHRQRLYWIVALMCIGSIFFSSSRSSVVATTVGVAAYLLFSDKAMGRGLKKVLVIIGIATLAFPWWGGALEGINKKNEASLSEGVNLNSRENMWIIRLEEWKDSPVYGIGFCAVSNYDKRGNDGTIEPGSSWLALLSMTGLIGFVLFCAIFFRALKNTLRFRNPESSLIGGVLLLIGVHMLAEGYIFSAGSFFCMFAWLTISVATDYGVKNG